MSRGTTVLWLSAMVIAAGGAYAQDVVRGAGFGNGTGIPLTRTIATDPLAREALALALARFVETAALVAEIERSDLVVHVVTGWLPHQVTGVVRFVAATPTNRYLRIVLRIPGAVPSLACVLAHELHHVVEIARMPDVRDEASLAAAYRRIGFPCMREGYFETAAAADAGRRARLAMAGRR